MPGFLPDTILDKFIGTLSKAIWNRPELHALREPIETTLQTYEFKQLTRNTLHTFYERYQGRIPDFLDDGFIQQGPVQDELAKFIIEGREANLEELFRRYRDYVGGEENEARAAMEGYLWAVREEFAKHPKYGPILQARDNQTMLVMLHDLHSDVQAIATMLNKVLATPEIKAIYERPTGTHIFLSYSRKDAVIVQRIRDAVKKSGHEVWQDVSAIKGGDQWLDAIDNGIKRSYAMILVLSKQSWDSYWVKEEFAHAQRYKRLIIPIKIDTIETPFGMNQLNPIAGYTDLDMALQQLIRSLPEAPEGKPRVEPQTRRAIEVEYLNRLMLEHSVWQQIYTPMAGVGQMRVEHETDDEDKIEMVTMPTQLDTILIRMDTLFAGADEKPRHVQTEQRAYTDILDAIHDMRQLVILGDPGSGKTTTLWRVVADFADKALANESQPLPVFVRFGEMNPGDNLRDHIAKQLGPDLSRYYDMLLDKRRLIFLLDGLNELPAPRMGDRWQEIIDWRVKIVEELRQLVKSCLQNNQIIAVTCRELDYTAEVDLGIAEQVQIEPLNPLQIKAFVNNYIAKPPGKGDELFWTLAGEEAYDYWLEYQFQFQMTEEHFWLSQATLPNIEYVGELEDIREVILIYRRWEEWLDYRRHPRNMLSLARNPYMLFMITRVFTQQKGLPDNRGRLFAGFIDYLLVEREKLHDTVAGKLKDGLVELAYAVQSKGIGTSFYLQIVTDYLDDKLIYHARSANLLTNGDPVRFTHQLLQEYFATLKLEQLIKADTPATDFWSQDNWWEPTSWEETAILLTGIHSHDPEPIISWLKDVQPELTARCILESGVETPSKRILDNLRRRWLSRLTDLKRDPQAHARAAIGRGLGKLWLDNRRGVGLDENGLPDFDWMPIMAGEYVLGDYQSHGSLPPTLVEIDTFFIACYPVTVAQFAAFVEDNGYFREDFWTRAGWEWKDNISQPKYWQDDELHISNHPIVGVSWYEAYAFSQWVSNKLGYAISLPHEYQWETAARGKKQRIFAYPGKFDAAKCNVNETDLGRTSSVGIFSTGTSPEGIHDLTGNVWEWCQSQFDDGNPESEGESARAIRGGSYNDESNYARAAARIELRPDLRDELVGFRVVCVSPI